ncbi:hypothetical protein AGABI2DRAFT_142244 [Agaricus bisporus var. bisporus H97]|uniref:hypothetical protein n=1 Tax=Agaricus bisporus var. bisporus (strain H97 / ATCC MYA-4626 / FGSC 10389) TaxID=936046 RepID=UPI00029F6BCA|nr:hypothetical protein AGABI2DRAFT_142244 [Agaricus bisporus var. bisporus H97]EKV47965.1 hypothetical protein AGABI2DRAFT_142244 [Agaricus bisporus var. bisporus H97]
MARTNGLPRKTTTSSHMSVRTIGHMQAMAGGRYNEHLQTKARLATQKGNETEETEVELMLALSDEEEADVEESWEKKESQVEVGIRHDQHHLALAHVAHVNSEEVVEEVVVVDKNEDEEEDKEFYEQ